MEAKFTIVKIEDREEMDSGEREERTSWSEGLKLAVEDNGLKVNFLTVL